MDTLPKADNFPYYPSSLQTRLGKRAIGMDPRNRAAAIGNPPATRQSNKRARLLRSIEEDPQTSSAAIGNLAATQRTNKKAQLLRAQQQRMPPAHTKNDLPKDKLKLPLGKTCTKCLAKKMAYETLFFCCADGAIELPSNEFPPALIRLYSSPDEDAMHFRKYARMYNNLFAFSSIGGDIDAKSHKGIYVFKLHGQIYHYVPNLIPNNSRPKFLQLYFYDGQHEALNRTDCFQEIQADIIDILMEITQLNPYARFFRSLKDIPINEQTQILLNRDTVPNQRVYNAPTTDEVAVIWSENSSSSLIDSPHIIVTATNNETHRIMHYYGCYDPLQYPLLFPCGECGWVKGLKKKAEGETSMPGVLAQQTVLENTQTVERLLEDESNRAEEGSHTRDKVVSCRQYYCYKLQNRPGNMLLKAGHCFQQYLVDMYVKIENTRLDFFRNNQETIRAELYQGILDTIETRECSAANVGTVVILPPTFLGGPRDMKKRYLNAMSLVHRYGKPDLFVTMTCNASWPEIKEELGPNEEAQNRPDIVARVFRSKLLALKKQIVDKQIFGEVAAFVFVVEFQKRGLPHAHFLIILKSGNRLQCPADYDTLVSAEIPRVSDSSLRTSVLKHMMHGPCGELNRECPCMKHKQTFGRCKYEYPKPFAAETTNNSDGFPMYRRRDAGDSAVIRKHTLDNRWVIPYNPHLLALFDCHLNVEVCSTMHAVKYLYKYIYKGHHKIAFTIVDGEKRRAIDEITQFQSGRWVSPCEAAWRIFRFDLFETQPPVMPLQVHLPNMQTIRLRPNENLADVVANAKKSRTPLTEFFTASAVNGCPKLLYREFTEHYRWDAGQRSWFKRKNKLFVIGRLVFVAPAEGERYFLRLLLLHVRGPTSFENLLTVYGYKCATFQEAALRHRILEHDDAAELCLAEACQVQMPIALRRLFSTFLIFAQPKDPALLWETHYGSLSEDYRHQFPDRPLRVHRLTARAVEKYLEAMGKSLKSFGLDHLDTCCDVEMRRTRDITDALDAPIPDESRRCRALLNTTQNEAFAAVIDHVINKKSGAFFIDGPGGTGKTFLYNALYAEVRLMDKIVLATASSGIAASNIPSGRTTHSMFRLSLDPDISLTCDVPKQSSLAVVIRAASLIIWDEASMSRRQNVESLDLLLRDLCVPDLIFGGKVVVFGGDFRQTLPVVPRKSQSEIVEASLVSSELWPQVIKFRLTENIRAKEDPEFAEFLLKLGNATLQSKEFEYIALLPGMVRLPEDIGLNPITDLTSVAFPELDLDSFDSDMFTTRAILTPLNDDVDIIKNLLIDKFPGRPISYKSYDSILDDNCNVYPAEFIHKLNPGGMSPHDLILKENCPVILLRNLQPSFGLCNGTRMICKNFYPNSVECVISIGHHKGEHVFIPRIKLRPAPSTNYPFQFQRNQFPLKWSFAMTINKCQGQTLSQVAIYLPRPCFSHGQLYVAISRARKASQVTVIAAPGPADLPSSFVKNIVSYSALERAGIIP